MSSFLRENLPDPVAYFESTGLALIGKGVWRSTECKFHGSRATLRVNTKTGSFICMAGCGARGGDVLAHYMADQGVDFITAAKALGAWKDDGTDRHYRPATIPARALLEAVAHEVVVASIVASDLSKGLAISEADRLRLVVAAGRIGRIADLVKKYA